MIQEIIATLITPAEVTFIYMLSLSALLGYIIGHERESRGKAAGISTHIFVISGAALFTYLSSVSDPNSQSRIAAQIVSGIGFLGAGLILKDNSSRVRNLTTAASVWFAGAIGMAIGFEFYVIACIAAICSVVVPRIHNHETLTEKFTSLLK